LVGNLIDFAMPQQASGGGKAVLGQRKSGAWAEEERCRGDACWLLMAVVLLVAEEEKGDATSRGIPLPFY